MWLKFRYPQEALPRAPVRRQRPRRRCRRRRQQRDFLPPPLRQRQPIHTKSTRAFLLKRHVTHTSAHARVAYVRSLGWGVCCLSCWRCVWWQLKCRRQHSISEIGFAPFLGRGATCATVSFQRYRHKRGAATHVTHPHPPLLAGPAERHLRARRTRGGGSWQPQMTEFLHIVVVDVCHARGNA